MHRSRNNNSLKEILKKLLKLLIKKDCLFQYHCQLLKLSAKFFQLMPKPLLTEDQLNLLKYDNISSGKYKNNFDIEIPQLPHFEQEVEKYCFYVERNRPVFCKKK